MTEKNNENIFLNFKKLFQKVVSVFLYLKSGPWRKNFPFEEIKKNHQFSKVDTLEITLSSYMGEWPEVLQLFILFVKKFNKKEEAMTKYVRIQFYVELKFQEGSQYSHLLPSTPIAQLDLDTLLKMLNIFKNKYKKYFDDAYGRDTLKSVKLKALWRWNIQKKVLISSKFSWEELEKSIFFPLTIKDQFKIIYQGLKTLLFSNE